MDIGAVFQIKMNDGGERVDQTPEERYREELKKRLTEKRESAVPTYYSKTGFRRTSAPEQKPVYNNWTPPRRRLGLVLMLPIVFILMMSNNLRGIIIPMLVAAALYVLIKRKK